MDTAVGAALDVVGDARGPDVLCGASGVDGEAMWWPIAQTDLG